MGYKLALVEFLDEDLRTHIEIEHDESAYTQTFCEKRTSAYWATVYDTERTFPTCLTCVYLLSSAFETTPSLTSKATSASAQEIDRFYSVERAAARCFRPKSSSRNPDTAT